MNEPNWERSAACAPQNRSTDEYDIDWFSNNAEEKYRARAVCQSKCPVRAQCIQNALNNEELHGIWGGIDDYEIRRAMSVDSKGDPSQRSRPPRCPSCMSKQLNIAGQKTKKGYHVECTKCSVTWHMATIPTKLKARKMNAA